MKRFVCFLVSFCMLFSISVNANQPNLISLSENVERYASIDYEQDGEEIKVSSACDAILYIATYDRDKLIAVETHDIDAGTVDAPFDFTSSQKAFVWDENLEPLCPPFSIGNDTDSGEKTPQAGTTYSITGIEMEDSVVNVTVNTNSPSLLVVSFLTEDTQEILTTVSTTTPSYCELNCVSIGFEYKLPKYYLIVADLYDNDHNKLCNSFTDINHTSKFEEFDKQTVDDFSPDRVVNFDDDASENFGVFKETVKRITSTETVNVLTVEEVEPVPNTTTQTYTSETNIIYKFENTDESVLNLQIDDTIYINDTSHLFKIGDIRSENGNVILMPSSDVDLRDFYDVLTIDMEMVPQKSGTEVTLMQEWSSFTLGGDINWKPQSWLTISGRLSGDGKLRVKLSYDNEIFEDDYLYFEVILDIVFNVSVGVDVSISNEEAIQKAKKDITEIVLGKINVPTAIPGLTIELKPSIPLEVEFTAGAEIEYTSNIKTGFTYSTYDGIHNIDKKTNQTDVNAEGRATVKMGPELSVSVNLLNGVFKTGIVVGCGIKTTILDSCSTSETDTSKHACTLCLEGYINWYAQVYANATYVIIKNVLEGELARWHIINIEDGEFPQSSEFYISLINSPSSCFGGKPKFGWGKCPNESYKTTILFYNEDGILLDDASIFVESDDETFWESGNNPLTVYLHNGRYCATGICYEVDDYATEHFVVNGTAKTVVLNGSSFNGWKVLYNGRELARIYDVESLVVADILYIDGKQWCIYSISSREQQICVQPYTGE